MSEQHSEFSHMPVMLYECIDALAVRPDGLYVDCTAGGGGHSEAIIKLLTTGKLIAVDRDPDAIEAVRKRLAGYSDRLELVNTNFTNIAGVLGGRKIDGALIDLGVSSYQIDTPVRGFSYIHDAPLDMRMDRTEGTTAADVVNGYSERELSRILFEYGEEKYARRIAAEIAASREEKAIKTTFELVDIIKRAVPAKYREGGSHPAKRTFQAIRIEVNGELSAIEPALRALVDAMNPGGRLAVISFHSLEDRIVKQCFADMSRGCTCPPDFPVCVCGKKAKIVTVGKKAILPSEKELAENSRAHSAKLRVAERITE